MAAIRDQECAGLDIVTDGEMRRESYSNRFATALDGVDLDNPGTTINRSGRPIPVPRVTGRIARRAPVEVRDMRFLRANTSRATKITVPGPFTMAKQAQDDFYRDEAAMALDYAAAVNAEIKDLFAAGADIVQIDEPWMQQHPEKARQYGLAVLDRALDGVTGTVAIHLCFGYAAVVHDKPQGYSFLPELEGSKVQQVSIEAAQPKLDLRVLRDLPSKTIILGVIDLADPAIETPAIVADRIRRALRPHPAGTDRGRARLRHEIPAARGRVRKDVCDGRGRADRARRIAELAPLHSITSSARASSVGGTVEAERLGGLEVDDQLVLGRRLHRQVGRLLALEDAVDVAGRSPVQIDQVGPIGHQAAGRDEEAIRIDRGQLVPRRERDDQIAMNRRDRAHRHDQTAVRTRAKAATSRSISPAIAQIDRAQLHPSDGATAWITAHCPTPAGLPACPERHPRASLAARSP